MGKMHVDGKLVECPQRFVSVQKVREMASVPQRKALAKIEPDGRLRPCRATDQIDTDQEPHLTELTQFKGW